MEVQRNQWITSFGDNIWTRILGFLNTVEWRRLAQACKQLNILINKHSKAACLKVSPFFRHYSKYTPDVFLKDVLKLNDQEAQMSPLAQFRIDDFGYGPRTSWIAKWIATQSHHELHITGGNEKMFSAINFNSMQDPAATANVMKHAILQIESFHMALLHAKVSITLPIICALTVTGDVFYVTGPPFHPKKIKGCSNIVQIKCGSTLVVLDENGKVFLGVPQLTQDVKVADLALCQVPFGENVKIVKLSVFQNYYFAISETHDLYYWILTPGDVFQLGQANPPRFQLSILQKIQPDLLQQLLNSHKPVQTENSNNNVKIEADLKNDPLANLITVDVNHILLTTVGGYLAVLKVEREVLPSPSSEIQSLLELSNVAQKVEGQAPKEVPHGVMTYTPQLRFTVVKITREEVGDRLIKISPFCFLTEAELLYDWTEIDDIFDEDNPPYDIQEKGVKNYLVHPSANTSKDQFQTAGAITDRGELYMWGLTTKAFVNRLGIGKFKVKTEPEANPDEIPPVILTYLCKDNIVTGLTMVHNFSAAILCRRFPAVIPKPAPVVKAPPKRRADAEDEDDDEAPKRGKKQQKKKKDESDDEFEMSAEDDFSEEEDLSESDSDSDHDHSHRSSRSKLNRSRSYRD